MVLVVKGTGILVTSTRGLLYSPELGRQGHEMYPTRAELSSSSKVQHGCVSTVALLLDAMADTEKLARRKEFVQMRVPGASKIVPASCCLAL